MKAFENITNKTYTFSSCDTCEARCCNGATGSTYAQILIEDFETIAPYFPILFIKGELGFLKPIVLLTNGKEFCPYIKDLKCTIYDNRPSVCRIYPFSANIDNSIYIDMNCPCVNETGIKIVDKGVLHKSFYYKTLDDYQEKYIKTHLHLDPKNSEDKLAFLFKKNAVLFYKFINDFDDEYLKLHRQSLKHLDKEYYK